MNMKIENKIPNVDNNPSTPTVDQVMVMITLCVNLRDIIINFRFKYIIGTGTWLVCKTAGCALCYTRCAAAAHENPDSCTENPDDPIVPCTPGKAKKPW